MKSFPSSGTVNTHRSSRLEISGFAAILVGNLVMHLCEWLVNEHLDSMETMSRFDFGLSDPESRPSRRRSCNHRVSMAKVMITQIARV